MLASEQAFLFAFPILFIGMWLLITTILSRLSGWPGLSDTFPDRTDEALIKFGAASGRMGLGVSYSNCLVVTVCRQGLRVGLWKMFGLFDRPFFVPWDRVTVERANSLLGKRVTLRFGNPLIGHLQISSRFAEKLAAAAGARWPEPIAVRRGATVN